MEGFILVTLHAGIIRDPGLNLGNIYDMRWVTGGAGGNDGGIFFPQFTLDDFLMCFLNPCMALHTGAGNPVR